MSPRYRHQRDANQSTVVAILRRLGVTVEVVSHLKGLGADILTHWRGRTLAFELKDGRLPPHRRRLSPAEARMHAKFPDLFRVAECPEDVLAAYGITTRLTDSIVVAGTQPDFDASNYERARRA